ncbi:MAG TPA: dTDP-4-dehydrorhamnose reductase [Puia sp.]|nr:dTDP-4-dehydrorhamnose reductase [Puia sp.]
MEKQTILVTGANGQLGRELQLLAGSFPAFEFVFTDRNQLSIEDPQQVLGFFAEHRPAWCINCAAYTAVDKAETEKETAFRVNGDAPGYLAAACRNTGSRLIHVSTDYVFDGSSATPLKEDNPTGPINSYGASKLEGEHRAMENHPDGTIIIRTAWVYSEFGNNFVKTMIRLMKERPAINVVDDQVGSPTYAADLAAAILHIVSSPRFVPGIYHYSNEGRISWYQFATAIREHIGSACTVNPIPSSQFPTPAKRPHYSLLDKTRIRSTYQVSIPDWETSLVTCLSRL